jgi:hypothetical protein
VKFRFFSWFGLYIPHWPWTHDPPASTFQVLGLQACATGLAFLLSEELFGQAPVTYTCNPGYLGSWDWEDFSSRPAQADSSWDPISKITTAKWTGGVAQAIEHLLLQARSSEFRPQSPPPHTHTRKDSLYILDNSPLSQTFFARIFSMSVAYIFILLTPSLVK